MGECTEGAPRAVAGVLNVVAFCRFIDLWVKLLLGPETRFRNLKKCFLNKIC